MEMGLCTFLDAFPRGGRNPKIEQEKKFLNYWTEEISEFQLLERKQCKGEGGRRQKTDLDR